jgi:hypothetical protein
VCFWFFVGHIPKTQKKIPNTKKGTGFGEDKTIFSHPFDLFSKVGSSSFFWLFPLFGIVQKRRRRNCRIEIEEEQKQQKYSYILGNNQYPICK